MIPLTLHLSGFLSYRDPVEIDFTVFDLACISGANGAGKSSLLDAITWSLFGQARRPGDAVINTRCETAEVILTFSYEGNIYRVQRIKPRNKTTVLEFHIRQPNTENGWKPLTERTLRDTQARIDQTLHLDYETFINAAFFLQGRADQFTQQRPSDRKRILGSILGLEIWEAYRRRAGEKRRSLEAENEQIEGRLQEIEAELAEEEERKAHLAQLERELKRLEQARTAQETAVDSMRKIADSLAEKQRFVDTLARQLETAQQAFLNLEQRLAARKLDREDFAQTLARGPEIEAEYQAWQAARQELSAWEETASRYREHEERRRKPLLEIETERARLESDAGALSENQSRVDTLQKEIPELQHSIEEAASELDTVRAKADQRAELEVALRAAQEEKANAVAENPRLRDAMADLKERIDQLESAEGALCPLCGQPLSLDERDRLIDELTQEGKVMGDRFRANKTLLAESDQRVQEIEGQIHVLSRIEETVRGLVVQVERYETRLSMIESRVAEWEAGGAARLADVRQALETESYAPEARALLEGIDAELKEIGYDAAAHDATRRREEAGRAAEASLRQLESARSASKPIEREIKDLETQIEQQQAETQRQETEHDRAAAELAAAAAEAPDLESAERQLYDLQEEENRLRMEVGAANQKVMVLGDLKARRKGLTAEREKLARKVGQYRQLERAFGKDGVPALLIEQALPQIETKANEILDRLTGGGMFVRFVTQAEYKDTKRDDLKETLDIQISDSAGMREYEMYSGGEAFRVNFAIRLALSEVLAQRAGARLQTLVIDEGFGSQDNAGRQRLIEAINMVRQDFAKILVITHIDELKDVFPTRLEVQKTPRGSTVEIL